MNIGDKLMLEVVLENTSVNGSAGIEVGVTIPSWLSYFTHSGMGTFVSSTGLWTLSTLAGGEKAVLNIVAVVATAEVEYENFSAVVNSSTGGTLVISFSGGGSVSAPSTSVFEGVTGGANTDLIAEWIGGADNAGTPRLDVPRTIITNRGFLGMGFAEGEAPSWPFHLKSYWTSGNNKYFEETKVGDQLLYLKAIGNHRKIAFYRANGDLATRDETIVLTGQALAQLDFNAHDGAGYDTAARIEVGVIGTPADNQVGGKIDFYANTDGGVLTKHLTVDGDTGVTVQKVLTITPMTAAAASALTPAEGNIVMVSDTDGTFTSIGLWAYMNGAWAAL